MKKVFSGIQPTGDLHIGNYLGALKNWVGMLDEYDCIFCIVDLHAITIKYNIEEMQSRIYNAASTYIACGLDPNKCKIFVQSKVPQHTELSWILNTVTPIGELYRMTQFKDKSKSNVENVNSGLLTYPVLMTSDIILYKADTVPVGEDQVQHVELAREIVRKFNARYGDVFPEPMEKVSRARRIMGLDGERKMSKSLNNHIALLDSEDDIKEKILRKAITDENRKRKSDPGDPDICNVFSYHQFFSSKEEISMIDKECRCAGIGCVDCKKMLVKNIMDELQPIQEKKNELDKNKDIVYDVLNDSAKKCRKIADDTMNEVKTAMGLL